MKTDKPVILSIDTGTEVCSVALQRGTELVRLIEDDGGQDHSRRLAVFIKEILASEGLAASDLDAVAVGQGPGSYTGLRIGVSTAKGICYGAGIPLIAINPLLSLARLGLEQIGRPAAVSDCLHGLDGPDFSATESDSPGENNGFYLCPMIDARRMEVYAQVFDKDLVPQSEVGAYVVTGESFLEYIGCKPFYIFGSGAEKCAGVLPADGVTLLQTRISARGMVVPAYEAYVAGQFVDTAYFEPFYLKDFIVTTSRKKLF